MPYFLAPPIRKKDPALWGEGSPYSSEVIYDICSGNPVDPPIHYESHQLKPHSVCHFDAPGHIHADGLKIDGLYEKDPTLFYGAVALLVFEAPKFAPHSNAPHIQHWEISQSELKVALGKVEMRSPLKKLIISFQQIPSDFYQSKTHALTLSEDAAKYLRKVPGFNLFGTPWKSADFQPGSRKRPVHHALLPQAGILECLNLSGIPAGEYFLAAPPLPLEGATESPAAPLLFTREELQF